MEATSCQGAPLGKCSVAWISLCQASLGSAQPVPLSFLTPKTILQRSSRAIERLQSPCSFFKEVCNEVIHRIYIELTHSTMYSPGLACGWHLAQTVGPMDDLLSIRRLSERMIRSLNLLLYEFSLYEQ